MRPPDTSDYTTIELVSCLVAPSACAYGTVKCLLGAQIDV
jgi:hypothetical protein